MGAKSSKLQKIHHKHPACEGLVTTIPKIDGGALARIRSAQRRCQRGKCVCVIVPVSLYSESNCVFISMAILDLLHRGFAAKRYGLVEDTPANYKICANKIRSGFFRYLVGRVGLSAEEAKRELYSSEGGNTPIFARMLKHLASYYDCCIELRAGCRPQGRLYGKHCRRRKPVFILNKVPRHVNAQFFIEHASEQQYLPAGFVLYHTKEYADKTLLNCMQKI